jgi:hypothetical protein
LFFLNPGKVDPVKNPDQWIAKNVEKKVNPGQLDEFVSLAVEVEELKDPNNSEAFRSAEIRELMKDVPENEIRKFLNETVALESTVADDVFMN